MARIAKPWQLDEETRRALRDEWRSIRAARPGAKQVAGVGFVPPDLLEKPAPFGLAFSGGGNRSATFNLGILQALAEKRLLRRVDYLSTVSGGGYAGSWLSALIRRQGDGNVAALEAPGPVGIAPPVQGHEAGEHPAILHLRRYSNYLTPRFGLFSIDTLAAVANLLRNVMLNMPILIGLIALLLVLPRALAQVAEVLYPVGKGGDEKLLVAAALLVLAAAVGVAVGLQSLERLPDAGAVGRDRAGPGQLAVFASTVLPGFLGVVAFVWWAVAHRGTCDAAGGDLWRWTGIGALAYTAIWGVAWGIGRLLVRRPKAVAPRARSTVLVAVLSPLAGGAATGALLYACMGLLDRIPAAQAYWLALGVGSFLAWEVLCTGIVAHVGMGKRLFSEPMREWLGRAGGQSFALGLPWLALVSVALYGPPLLAWFNEWLLVGGGLAWLATTVGGVILARGEKTGGDSGAKRPWAEALTRVAPYVFIFGLAVLLAAGAERGLMTYGEVAYPEREPVAAQAGEIQGRVMAGRFELSLAEGCRDEGGCALRAWFERQGADFATLAARHRSLDQELERRAPEAVWYAMALLLFAVLLLAWRVDVNLFSMHQFYRNRLTRCYLGASRPDRCADAFTDFDFADDLPMAALRGQRPLHIVCATLNITRSEHLEWQQRQAASFVFTPSECGFRLPDGRDSGAFRPTDEYMVNEGGVPANGGARLGMAVAVSGAAASPNMGYHTSPATAFLMTFFNVRLGRWCGNPRHPRAWRRSSPVMGLRYLVSELLATADEQSAYVNLSDGGHFENLGIYELVRRRCRLIVVCDAGCDPEFQFEDLGNAIRKCRVDLGAEITIDVKPLVAADPARRARFVVGRIVYSDTEAPGILVYVKPLLKDDEPVDVRHYAETHDSFPHQPTSDQWFDEAQFESYRQLGLVTGREVFGRYLWQVDGEPAGDNDAWVEAVARRLEKTLPTDLSMAGAAMEGGT